MSGSIQARVYKITGKVSLAAAKTSDGSALVFMPNHVCSNNPSGLDSQLCQ